MNDVHAVAVDFNGQIYTANGFTPPHVPPVRLRDTNTTTARMAKVTARFGHPVEEVEVG